MTDENNSSTPVEDFSSEIDRIKTIEHLRSLPKPFSVATPSFSQKIKPVVNSTKGIIAQTNKGTVRRYMNTNPNPRKTIKNRDVGGKKNKKKKYQKRYKSQKRYK